MKSLTKLEQERKSKQVVGEFVEKIKAMGDENEDKAAKAVIEVGKLEEEQEKKIRAAEEEILNAERIKKERYKVALLENFQRKMLSVDLPSHWRWGVKGTSKGIILCVESPLKKAYCHGMSVSGTPKYDLNCVDRMITRALDFMENNDKSKLIV